SVFQSPSRRGLLISCVQWQERLRLRDLSVPFAKGITYQHHPPHMTIERISAFSPLREGDYLSAPTRNNRRRMLTRLSVPFAKGITYQHGFIRNEGQSEPAFSPLREGDYLSALTRSTCPTRNGLFQSPSRRGLLISGTGVIVSQWAIFLSVPFAKGITY